MRLDASRSAALRCRHASGTAEQPIVVYGRPSSSNTQKVLWILEEAQVPYTLTLASARLGADSELLCEKTNGEPFGVVDTAEYLKHNPHGRIPTIHDPRAGEGAVWESHTIVRYLVRAYLPTWLGGLTLLEQARSEMWMDWVLGPGDHLGTCFSEANHHMIDEVARTTAGERDLAVVERGHNTYVAVLTKAEAQLGDGRKYIAGDEPSVADVPLAVELNRWSLCHHALNRDGLELPVPKLPALAKYYDRLLLRLAFLRGVYGPEARHQRLAREEELSAKLRLAGQDLSA